MTDCLETEHPLDYWARRLGWSGMAIRGQAFTDYRSIGHMGVSPFALARDAWRRTWTEHKKATIDPTTNRK